MNEQREIDHLAGKGFEIRTQLFGRTKIWLTKKMTLGRLIQLSEVFLKMEIEKDFFSKNNLDDIITDQYQAVNKNARNAAKAIAISVTDKTWFRPFLVRHFLRNISSEELLSFSTKLLKQGDYQNFILSIGLMNGNRITKADQVEKTA